LNEAAHLTPPLNLILVGAEVARLKNLLSKEIRVSLPRLLRFGAQSANTFGELGGAATPLYQRNWTVRKESN
jgi:hypothetical protein